MNESPAQAGFLFAPEARWYPLRWSSPDYAKRVSSWPSTAANARGRGRPGAVAASGEWRPSKTAGQRVNGEVVARSLKESDERAMNATAVLFTPSLTSCTTFGRCGSYVRSSMKRAVRRSRQTDRQKVAAHLRGESPAAPSYGTARLVKSRHARVHRADSATRYPAPAT